VLFVVTGPSGCGKSTILRHILKDIRRVKFSVSHTTRPRRPSERDGREYHFVSKAEFERLIARDRFLEWAEVHGNYYGTSKAEVVEKGRGGGDVLLDIDVQGARQVRDRRPDAVFVFVIPPRFSELQRRLRDRGEDSPAELARRLRNAKKEVREVGLFDYVIVNDRLDRAVLELEAIILSSRCRTDVRLGEIKAILASFR
jgi:guanylate kinase